MTVVASVRVVMRDRWYPPFERVMRRWIWTAYTHNGQAKITLRFRFGGDRG